MLTIGDKFPTFQVKAVVSVDRGKEFAGVTERSFEGKRQIVRPTEIAAFGEQTLTAA